MIFPPAAGCIQHHHAIAVGERKRRDQQMIDDAEHTGVRVGTSRVAVSCSAMPPAWPTPIPFRIEPKMPPTHESVGRPCRRGGSSTD